MRDRQAWRKAGNCSGLTYKEIDAIFFLGRGGSPKKAKQEYCATCPVKQRCFEYAVVHNLDGIWGGSTEKERRRIAPLLRPALREKAVQEGWLEEHRMEPIFVQPSCADSTQFPYAADELYDTDPSSSQLTDSLP